MSELFSEDCALIVVDLQNDFCPDGALGVQGGDAVVPLANRLMPLFPKVVLTQDWHPPGHSSFASSHPGKSPFEVIELDYGEQVLWPDHCVQGSKGAAFHEALETSGAEAILRKGYDPAIDSYSAFYENDHKTPTGLGGYLRERGVGQVYLMGLATDYCVYYSAMDALQEGFQVRVIEDACRAIDLEGSLERALGDMHAAGVAFTRSGSLLS